MTMPDLRAVIDRAFTDAGPIYDSDGPKARILAAAADVLAAEQRASDQQFLDDPAFGRRLEALMRRNPQLLERWIRQRNRMRGVNGPGLRYP